MLLINIAISLFSIKELRFLLMALVIESFTAPLVQANYIWDKENKLWKWVEKPDSPCSQACLNTLNDKFCNDDSADYDSYDIFGDETKIPYTIRGVILCSICSICPKFITKNTRNYKLFLHHGFKVLVKNQFFEIYASVQELSCIN